MKTTNLFKFGYFYDLIINPTMQNFTLRYLFKVQLIGIHEPKTLNYRNNYIKTQNVYYKYMPEKHEI